VWDEQPIALVDGTRLRAVSAAAARARVRPGMTVPEARAMCAGLTVIPWYDDPIIAATTTVTAALLAASPQVTPVAGEPGLWWVGAAGFDALGGERALARALVDVGQRWHPRTRVAIAGSCVAARAATWASGAALGPVRIPLGGDARYLARAPLALIPMDDEMRDTLAALGMRDAGAFAALEAEDVERRWGDEGLAAWRLARGEDDRRPVLARAAPPRTVDAELAASTPTMEPVLFLVRAALDTLASALVADGRAAAVVAITLTLDDARSALPRAGARAHTVTREIRIPRPTARAAHLFDHCRALLERWPLTAPACGVRVSITATAPLAGEQGDLLATEWRDPSAIDAALARLRAELGDDGVVKPVARDEHAPERAGAWIPGDTDAGDDDAGAAPEVANVDAERSALRLLETPEPAVVACDGDAPRAVRWRGRRIALAHVTGPERISGDWWRDDGYRRTYWQGEGDGMELVLFRERDAWYVQGWYD
jgi:protein ImuB